MTLFLPTSKGHRWSHRQIEKGVSGWQITDRIKFVVVRIRCQGDEEAEGEGEERKKCRVDKPHISSNRTFRFLATDPGIQITFSHLHHRVSISNFCFTKSSEKKERCVAPLEVEPLHSTPSSAYKHAERSDSRRYSFYLVTLQLILAIHD